MQAAVDEEDATFAGGSGSDYAEQKPAVAVVEGRVAGRWSARERRAATAWLGSRRFC